MSIFYRPDDGVAADFIPFYWDGDYHLFYLKDYRDEAGHGQGTPWFHLVTRDFVHFEDWGEALPRGAAGSQDVWVFTGSAIERNGTFHIFYTGHNSNFYKTDKPVQAVMHATSPDLRVWTKDEAFIFFAPEGYEKDDWRDPFVFWNDEAGEYWMLLAARKTTGPSRNRGCVALAASLDLQTWEVREPFWAPDLYFTHECPDLFRIGTWWYLVYSTFSERHVTHYRMSRSLHGPWLAPPNDTFDGRAYYAAKTAGDGTRRLVFGWLPTREGETAAVPSDDGRWQWGGNLVVHEIVQQPDGTLTVRAPDALLESFSQPVSSNVMSNEVVERSRSQHLNSEIPRSALRNDRCGQHDKDSLAPQFQLGNWTVDGNAITSSSISRFSALMVGAMPDRCLIETSVTFEEGTVNCGLLLRADESLNAYYQLRLEPAHQRMVIDRWQRPGDQPSMLERPLKMTAGQSITLRAIADGTCLVVYANDRVALSCRMYDHRAGALGLFVTEGKATFESLAVKTTG